MSKAKTSAILVLSLWIAMTLFTAPTWSQTQTVSIKFTAHTLGYCFVDYGDPPGPSGGPPWPADWYGIGIGEATFGGVAEAVPIEIPEFEDAYFSVSLKAHGTTSFSWVEEDGSKHRIIAHLYSTETTDGLFLPKEDYFTVPREGPDLSSYLGFKGIHKIDSVVQEISGIASFYSAPLPPQAGPLQGMWVTFVGLLDIATQKVYWVMWTPKQIEASINPWGSFAVPAARILRTEVKIMNH